MVPMSGKVKFFIGVVAVLLSVLGIYFVLSSENALVAQPKGIIAQRELEVIVTIILLMLIVIVPTFIFLFYTVWRHHNGRAKAKYDPEHSYGKWGEWLLWLIPAAVVAVMVVVNWNVTHELDPYRPLESPVKPLQIQVVAIDWKWLFIYPELGIATLNYLEVPDRTPIRLHLTADNSPMNSFWIPQLSGQIYSMTGMTTQLHLMADAPGEYRGKAVEINGMGYADMTFVVKSSSQADFDAWTEEVRRSPLKLTKEIYDELAQSSIIKDIVLYSEVEHELFQKILKKYE